MPSGSVELMEKVSPTGRIVSAISLAGSRRRNQTGQDGNFLLINGTNRVGESRSCLNVSAIASIARREVANRETTICFLGPERIASIVFDGVSVANRPPSFSCASTCVVELLPYIFVHQDPLACFHRDEFTKATACLNTRLFRILRKSHAQRISSRALLGLVHCGLTVVRKRDTLRISRGMINSLH